MIHFIALIGFCFLWYFVYQLMTKKGLQSEVSLSILSMLHWFIAFVFFQTIVFFNLDRDVKELIFGNQLTEIQLWFHVITCSYFAFDLFLRSITQQLKQWLLIHHTFTLLFIAIAVINQFSGSENIYVLRYATFCNIPMNVKAILAKNSLHNTIPYHISNLLYTGIYTFNFTIMQNVMLYYFYISNTSMLTILMLILLQTQAYYTIVKSHVPSSLSSLRYFHYKYRNIMY